MSPSSASGLHAPGEQRAATRACSWLMPALWVAGAAADGHLQVSQWQWLAPHSQDRFLLCNCTVGKTLYVIICFSLCYMI